MSRTLRTTRTTRTALALLAPALTLATLALAGCDSSTAPSGNPAFTIEASDEQFTVEVATVAQAAELQARLDAGEAGVVNGELLAGDGGFNEPWSWHMDPATVHAVDAAIEVCDGRPSMMEDDLDYWLQTVERFCPWGARVVARVR